MLEMSLETDLDIKKEAKLRKKMHTWYKWRGKVCYMGSYGGANQRRRRDVKTDVIPHIGV